MPAWGSGATPPTAGSSTPVSGDRTTGTPEGACTWEFRHIRADQAEAFRAAGWTVAPAPGHHGVHGFIAKRELRGDDDDGTQT